MRKTPPLFTFNSQCRLKKQYSAREAQQIADRLHLRAYRCQWCSKRHLTSRGASE